METTNHTTDTMKATKWSIDTVHSSIEFIVRHMLITNVTGKFSDFSGYLLSEKEDFSDGKVYVEIDVASVDTGVSDRDNHLKSDDFFNAAQFPKIIFKGNEIKKKSGDDYQLTGDLTIRDITKPITLDVEFGGKITDPYGNERVGFNVSGKLNRLEYGLKWNALLETGGAVVSSDVKIRVGVSLIRQKD